jgi:hypothetical protein
VSSLAPIGAPTVSGPPVVDEARAPASVRNGSAAVKQAYASAQGFEEMLLQQLSSSLVQSSGLSGEGESSSEGSGEESSAGGGGEVGMLSSLLPQTLTEGVMREGGLGLATQLMGSLDPSASATAATHTSAGSTGGASTPTSAAATAAPVATALTNGDTAHTGGASS